MQIDFLHCPGKTHTEYETHFAGISDINYFFFLYFNLGATKTHSQILNRRPFSLDFPHTTWYVCISDDHGHNFNGFKLTLSGFRMKNDQSNASE